MFYQTPTVWAMNDSTFEEENFSEVRERCGARGFGTLIWDTWKRKNAIRICRQNAISHLHRQIATWWHSEGNWNAGKTLYSMETASTKNGYFGKWSQYLCKFAWTVYYIISYILVWWSIHVDYHFRRHQGWVWNRYENAKTYGGFFR